MGEALVGCPFPDFSMEIVGNHPSQGNGEHMRLTDLTSNGRPTLLQFYACKRDRTLLHDARATVSPLATRCVIPHAPEVQGHPPRVPHVLGKRRLLQCGLRQSGTLTSHSNRLLLATRLYPPLSPHHSRLPPSSNSLVTRK